MTSAFRLLPDHELDARLSEALGEIAADLALASPRHGPVPTIMVAANESDADTAFVAFKLGTAAADRGMSVLIVEGPRPRSRLAIEADPDGSPILVDACGELRLALPATGIHGLFLAPLFRNGRGIAAALTRNAQVDVMEDIAAEFNIIVIDGAYAVDAAMAHMSADAYLRVGHDAARPDSHRFLQALRARDGSLVGTVVASVFLPNCAERSGERSIPLSLVPKPAAAPQMPSSVVMPSARPAYPRRIALR